jgi:hypothetical protein
MCCAELTSTAQKQKKQKSKLETYCCCAALLPQLSPTAVVLHKNETEQGIDTTSSSAFPYCCCAALLPQLTLHSKIT